MPMGNPREHRMDVRPHTSGTGVVASCIARDWQRRVSGTPDEIDESLHRQFIEHQREISDMYFPLHPSDCYRNAELLLERANVLQARHPDGYHEQEILIKAARVYALLAQTPEDNVPAIGKV